MFEKRPFPGNLPSALAAIYREEADSWRLHYRRYFKHAVRALGIGFVLGFLFFMLRPYEEKRAMQFVMQSLKDIPLAGPPFSRAVLLFYHNSRASLVAAAAGFVPFLFLPILDPVLNGAVLGLLVSIAKHQGLDVIRLIVFQVLPHGIFEFAAIAYSAALGMYLSAEMGKKVRSALSAGKKRREMLRRAGTVTETSVPRTTARPGTKTAEAIPAEAGAPGSGLFRNLVRSFVLVVLPLFLVAAFIEAYITPLL